MRSLPDLKKLNNLTGWKTVTVFDCPAEKHGQVA
jgi:hypothetical protein